MLAMPRDILIIDDEPSVRNVVTDYLSKNGFNVDAAVDGKNGLELISRKEYDVAIVDLLMPGISGIELIHKIKALCPDTEIIVHTGQATLDTAIEAIRSQTFDYICKPAKMSVLTRSVQHAAERRFLIIQNRKLIHKLENERNGLQKEVMASKQAIKQHLLSSPEFVGESKNIAYVRHMISEVALSDMTVLIRGESGTGKDVVARIIHKWSGRIDTGNFVKINCPAISETLLESEMFGFFATGHYAQIVKSKSSYLLKKAADLSKDQTYFLYRLTPEQLSHTLFPLGIYTKQKVRELARSFGLETADRSESQDFIAGGDYSLFFNTEEVREGDIVDEKGNVLGNHRGIIYYTVGQRRGLGIASPKPLYVLKIDSENNRIVVGDKKNLLSIGLIATELNLIGIEKLNHSYEVKTKIRLKHKECDATLFPHEKDKAKILFTEPQKSVAPGQSVVFYKNDIVMGGGIIEQAL